MMNIQKTNSYNVNRSKFLLIPLNVFEMSETCNLSVTFGRNTYNSGMWFAVLDGGCLFIFTVVVFE